MRADLEKDKGLVRMIKDVVVAALHDSNFALVGDERRGGSAGNGVLSSDGDSARGMRIKP